MADIPECFNHPGAAFVTLPAGIKYPPSYKGWQEPKNWRTYERACKHGGNVGTVAGNSYIGLDQDDPATFTGLELPTTTTWETRPGRLAMRFKCSDDIPAVLAQHGKKADQAQIKLYKDGLSVGEVKLQRTYQIIPPSHKFIDPATGDDVAPGKGDRVDYKLLDSSPPAEISLEKLLADLQGLGITFSKLEANAKKLENKAKEARQKRVVSDETRNRKIAEAALHNEKEKLRSAEPGGRNDQLNKSMFSLAQFVPIGALSEDEIIATLALVAGEIGLDLEEIKKTLKSALDAGKQHPRVIPEAKYEIEAPPGDNISSGGLKTEDVAHIETDDDGKWISVTFSPTKAAGAVQSVLSLAMAKDTDEVFNFNGQIYEPYGARKIDMLLCGVAQDMVSANRLKEVLRRVKNGLQERPVTFNPDPYVLGVKNGLVDLRTGEMREYRPEDYVTDQIDVTYDPEAKCPRFLQFLEDVAPNPTDRLMLIDWYAIHAIREMFPYVLFLNGLGRNGKGIYERVLKRFFGEDAFSSMQLEELNVKNNRFAGADLAGKRGQIVSEAGGSQAKGKRAIPTAFLKNATGDGVIDSDQKNKGRIKFKPFYKATVDSNDMPRIEDSSKGWTERFCKADLPYSYVNDPDPANPLERKKDPHLFDKLTTPAELSGILNLILSRTPEIIKTGAITKRSGAEMFAEYQRQSNSVTTFLENFCGYKPTIPEKEDVPLEVVFKAYEDWCDLTVSDKVNDQRFGAAVKNLCNGIKSERIRGPDGNRIRIYHGFTFDAKAHQSQMSQPVPTLSQQNKKQSQVSQEIAENTWNKIKEKFGEEFTLNQSKNENPPLFSVPGTAIESQNMLGTAIDGVGTNITPLGQDIDSTTIREKASLSASGCLVESSDPQSTIGKIDRPTPSAKVKVRFKTAYRTDVDGGQMQNFEEGEIAEFSRERAEVWVKRGVVEITSAGAGR